MVHRYKAFVFDLDGTMYIGEQEIPGAADYINYLKENGKRVVFISNKTTGSAEEYSLLLRSFGVEAPAEDIVNSTRVIKKYLSERFAGRKFYAVGEELFIKEIESGGLVYTESPGENDVVLITLDRGISEKKINIAAGGLRKGARFFAANIDMTCPVIGGEIWDAGSTIARLTEMTGRELEEHFGKPSRYMFEEVGRLAGCEADEMLITGDRCETDVAMGNMWGADTALVLSGVKNPESGYAPTYVFESVGKMRELILK